MQTRIERLERRRRRAARRRWTAWSLVGLLVALTVVELVRTSPSSLLETAKAREVKVSETTASAESEPQPPEPKTLRLQVISAATSEIIPRAVVRVARTYLTADASGTVDIPSVFAEVVEVSIRAPGYDILHRQLALSAGDNFETVALEIQVSDELSEAETSATPAYLTIDDGPHQSYTSQVLDILANEKVRATFFIVGQRAEAAPDVVRRIYLEGHELGNHTYSHDYDALYAGTAAAYIDSLHDTGAVIEKIVGFKPSLTRPPGGEAGNFRPGWREAIRSAGYTTVLWNVTSGDGTETTAGRMSETVGEHLDRLAPKASPVILTHDVRATIIEALPGILREVSSRGYQLQAWPD